MKVYVLFGLDDSDRYQLIGVYKDRTLAAKRKAAIESYIANEGREFYHKGEMEYIIEESQVNEEES